MKRIWITLLLSACSSPGSPEPDGGAHGDASNDLDAALFGLDSGIEDAAPPDAASFPERPWEGTYSLTWTPGSPGSCDQGFITHDRLDVAKDGITYRTTQCTVDPVWFPATSSTETSITVASAMLTNCNGSIERVAAHTLFFTEDDLTAGSNGVTSVHNEMCFMTYDLHGDKL